MSNRIFKIVDMNDEQKERFVDITGKTVLYLAERRSLFYIARRLELEPWQVSHNIDETLYVLRKSLGWKRYIKALFMK